MPTWQQEREAAWRRQDVAASQVARASASASASAHVVGQSTADHWDTPIPTALSAGGAQRPSSPSFFAQGMNSFKRFEKGVGLRQREELGRAGKLQDGWIEGKPKVQARVPTPPWMSRIGPRSSPPPIPRSPPRPAVSRSASNTNMRVVTSRLPLQRAVTMHSPVSPPLTQEGPRPSSSYSPDTEFPRYNSKDGYYEGGHTHSRTASVGRADLETIPAALRAGGSSQPRGEYKRDGRGNTPPSTVATSRPPPSRTAVPSRSSMRRPSMSSITPTSIYSAGDSNETSTIAAGRGHGTKVVPETRDVNDLDRDDNDIPNSRPRAPTPSALAPSFQYSTSANTPSPPYTASTTTQSAHFGQHKYGHAHTSSTASTRARSQSLSAGRSSTPPMPAPPLPSAPISVPDEYTVEPYLPPPATPPHAFARSPKHTHPSYPDPAGFPTPPSYPPVPALVACGSSSTSTRSSAYTSPGASAPLSATDLSALGLGLGKYANREDEHDPTFEDEATDAGATTDKTIVPRSTSYSRSIVREASESSISRLQFAANAAAASTANGNGISHGWMEGYTPSTRSGSSSYEGSPIPPAGAAEQPAPKKIPGSKWRTVDEDGDCGPDVDESDIYVPPPSSYQLQRPRQGTVASSCSASLSGLTSASEDETDVDDYALPTDGDDEEVNDGARTAAIVVAEEGRGLIVHGEGMNVTALNIQPGTTHLLLASLVTPNSLPSLLTQTLPDIASTLLALDISANFLDALPPVLAACTQLTELNIASNPIRALPLWLAGLQGLRVLIADATGITTLPPELVSLKALNVLSIRRNKFMALPAWLARLPALERLEVEGNPFQGPWKALVAPLIATRPPVSAAISVPGETMRQQQQQLLPIADYNLNSLYGPGLSVYGEATPPVSSSRDAPGTPNDYQRQTTPPYSAVQGSFLSTTDSDSYSMPNSAVEPAAGGARQFAPEEEEHTIMPRILTSPSQRSLPSFTHLATPSSHFPVPSPSLTSPSQPSLNSPTQLPYMSTAFTRSDGAEIGSNSGTSPIQRAPTFSVADRRTPSPYLRPLSRTRTTPNRSRLSSGSANGSIATFVADQNRGDARSRTSSAASQRPHTDYAPTRYGGPPSVEDSGYYGSADYHAYERRSDGSEFFGGGLEMGTVAGATVRKEDERRQELRRMRSADELRRALESVIGPSEPMAPTREEDDTAGETETDRAPPFFVPKLDTRPPIKHHHPTGPEAAIMGGPSPVRSVTLTDRPGAKRFASLGPSQGLGTGVPTRARPGLMDGMWDAEGDADAEGDGKVGRRQPVSRALSPTERDKERDEDMKSNKGRKGRWGFLKKMSMGRIRQEGSRPSTSQGILSTRTSPQGANVQRTAALPEYSNGASPTPRPRQESREVFNSSPGSTAPQSAFANLQPHPTTSSLGVPQPRSAKRRSFLPLDGPPALNIPIPSTAPFLHETMIATNGLEDEMKLTIDTSPPIEQVTQPAPSQSEQHSNDSRALRSVMSYLRDMADLGMVNPSVPGPMSSANPSTFNLSTASPQDNEDARSRRPTIAESGRLVSEGSLASNTSLSSGFGDTSRSEEQGLNTMSVVTTDSNGSGKGDDDRSKHKDDKAKRAMIIKEIVETERTYVKGLQELIDIYVKPASLPVNTLGNAVASTKETVVPQQERKIVFNGLDSLFSFHTQSFLPALEQAAKPLLRAPGVEADATGEISMAAARSIANVFVSHAAFMRMYSTYINNFDNAVHRLKQWTVDRRAAASASGSSLTSPSSSTAHLAGMSLQMSVVNVSGMVDNASGTGLQQLTSSQRKHIKSYLKRCRLNPKHSQLNLEGYLLLPVQRIPRYRMLLEELVRYTPPKADAFDDPMDRALTEISSLASNMNEGKREAESRRKLVQWQTRIRGKFPSPLVQPHRRLIMDGPLHLTRVVRKSSMAFDVINSAGDKTNVQVECLAPEETPRSLVGILCNDLLVLCKDPSAGKDHAGPVDLWAVLRMQTLSQPASIIHGSALRVVDNKAILYFDAPSTSEALTWTRAINMHIPASKT